MVQIQEEPSKSSLQESSFLRVGQRLHPLAPLLQESDKTRADQREEDSALELSEDVRCQRTNLLAGAKEEARTNRAEVINAKDKDESRTGKPDDLVQQECNGTPGAAPSKFRNPILK
jgi:hypothetical protein